ncbi:hypothetical protein YPPY14_1436, partial [Yersinia pestis PY-14]
MPNKTIGWSSA